jgi:threonine aldolase
MRSADVGDDVYGRDPTVAELQRRGAAMVKKEAGLFMPSGTMANLAAVLAHTGRGAAVVLESDSHIARAETGGLAGVAGCMPLAVSGRGGVLAAADVEERLQPPDVHRPVPELLCVENTHGRAGGTVTSPEAMEGLREVCDRWRLRLHVDGARLLNGAVALDVEPHELVTGADSVCISLDKGLGAPVGSLLIGSHEFIRIALRMRKMLGGGMRQVGVVAAAGLVALDDWRARLRQDHRRARELAARVAGISGVRIDPTEVPTNIVLCDVSGTRVPAADLVRRLLEAGLACSVAGVARIRFVLHGQIGAAEIDRLGTTMEELVSNA